MRFFRATLLGLSSASLLAGLSAQDAGTSAETVSLSYKAAKKWSFTLPNETWTDATAGIKVPHANGTSFKSHPEGLALCLKVDTNGDGKVDKEVKGARGYLVLKAKDVDGESMSYAVRFRVEAKKYQYSTSGSMRGRLNGTDIQLIDQNNNGVYNEFGVDAMVVGKSRSASYLSNVVNVDGKLYQVQVSRDGRSIEASPYVGETGQIDLESGFDSKGKLLSAVVKSADGNTSFELSDGSMTVPVGSYQLAFGYASKGKDSVTISNGKMASMDVKPDRELTLDWGGPVMADFTFTKSGENVAIDPTSVHYYGKGGGEYAKFLPQGQSPKFLVYDERTQKLLKTGRFGT